MIYEAIDIWNSPSLEHHGVKGMKWGVRKQRQSLGNRIQAYRTKRHEDYIRKTFGEAAVMEGRREDSRVYKRKGLTKGQKTALKVGVGAAVAVGVGVGVYMLKKNGAKSVASVASSQLKSTGMKALPSSALKTPMKSVRRGPSTMRKTFYGHGYTNNSFTNSLADGYRVTANNMYATASQRAMARNAANIYGATNRFGSYTQTYRPSYVTNKGGRVSKRIVKLANGKTRILNR